MHEDVRKDSNEVHLIYYIPGVDITSVDWERDRSSRVIFYLVSVHCQIFLWSQSNIDSVV